MGLSIGKVVPSAETHMHVNGTAIVCDFMSFHDGAGDLMRVVEGERRSVAFDAGLTAIVAAFFNGLDTHPEEVDHVGLKSVLCGAKKS